MFSRSFPALDKVSTELLPFVAGEVLGPRQRHRAPPYLQYVAIASCRTFWTAIPEFLSIRSQSFLNTAFPFLRRHCFYRRQRLLNRAFFRVCHVSLQFPSQHRSIVTAVGVPQACLAYFLGIPRCHHKILERTGIEVLLQQGLLEARRDVLRSRQAHGVVLEPGPVTGWATSARVATFRRSPASALFMVYSLSLARRRCGPPQKTSGSFPRLSRLSWRTRRPALRPRVRFATSVRVRGSQGRRCTP